MIKARCYRLGFAERTKPSPKALSRSSAPSRPLFSLGPAFYPAAVACAAPLSRPYSFGTKASSKQSRRVSGGLSQHCIQL